MYNPMENACRRTERYRYNNQRNLYYSSFGKVSMEPSSFRRHHFLAGYRSRLSTEWTPTMRSPPVLPMVNQTPPIYLSTIGMLPHYGGHIPGGMYRFGQTFGNDTRDVKVWLRTIKPH